MWVGVWGGEEGVSRGVGGGVGGSFIERKEEEKRKIAISFWRNCYTCLSGLVPYIYTTIFILLLPHFFGLKEKVYA